MLLSYLPESFDMHPSNLAMILKPHYQFDITYSASQDSIISIMSERSSVII